LEDYLIICYFYSNNEMVFIANPVKLYFIDGAEVVVTVEKIYCIKNWDYKILYLKPVRKKRDYRKKVF